MFILHVYISKQSLLKKILNYKAINIELHINICKF